MPYLALLARALRKHLINFEHVSAGIFEVVWLHVLGIVGVVAFFESLFHHIASDQALFGLPRVRPLYQIDALRAKKQISDKQPALTRDNADEALTDFRSSNST